MNDDKPVLIGGESPADLFGGITDVQARPSAKGMTSIEAVLNPAMTRAIMRVEAELLLADADAYPGADATTTRTPAQRRHDAMLAVLQRLLDQAA